MYAGFQGQVGYGLTDVNYKRNIDIVQQDRDGTTLRRWSLSRALALDLVNNARQWSVDEPVEKGAVEP